MTEPELAKSFPSRPQWFDPEQIIQILNECPFGRIVERGQILISERNLDVGMQLQKSHKMQVEFRFHFEIAQ
jgi:hypothetical protein